MFSNSALVRLGSGGYVKMGAWNFLTSPLGKKVTVEITGNPADAKIELYADGATQVGNTIEVRSGQTVRVVASREGYYTLDTTIAPKEDFSGVANLTLLDSFNFTINSGDDSTFIIPMCSYMGDGTNWRMVVDWGDGTSEVSTGLGSVESETGISHTYPSANTNYQIKLSGYTGFLKHFGLLSTSYTNGCNAQENRDKIISLDSPMKARMFVASENEYVSSLLSFTFYKCTNLTMGETFNIPQDMTYIGNNCFASMFSGCSSLTMNDIFQLPQNLTTVGYNFCNGMFQDCSSLTMNDIFQLPQNLTTVGYSFCNGMFYGCSSVEMNDIFQLPQTITTAGSLFCCSMFRKSGLTHLNSIFQLPQNLTTIDSEYAYCMFRESLNLETLNDVFNFPQTITQVLNHFAYGMFFGCSKLKNVGVMQIPQNISIVEDYFCTHTFRECSALETGAIQFFGNIVLSLEQLDKVDVFVNTFAGNPAMTEEISVDTIPQLSISPSQNNYCFVSSSTVARTWCPIIWGGLRAPAFKFTINSGADSSFILPMASFYGNNWNWNVEVDWGDGTKERSTGTGNYNNGTGVNHTYPEANKNYQITIDGPMGYMNTFGFYGLATTGCNTTENRVKMLSLDTPIYMDSLQKNANGNTNAIFAMQFMELPNLKLSEDFNLPQEFQSIGNEFAYAMFAYCTSLDITPNFTLPQNVTSVGFSFCQNMFEGCTGITTGGNFTLPTTNLTSVGYNFATNLFYACSSMVDVSPNFNLPANLTTIPDGFAQGIFNSCAALQAVPASFNVPQNVTAVGNNFLYGLFYGCSALTSIGALQLPQGLTEVGQNLAYLMCYNCTSLTGGADQFFGELILPVEQLDKSGVFYGSFANTTAFTEAVSYETIPQLTVNPSSVSNQCFAGCASASAPAVPYWWMYYRQPIYAWYDSSGSIQVGDPSVPVEYWYTVNLQPTSSDSLYYLLDNVLYGSGMRVQSYDSTTDSITTAVGSVCPRAADHDYYVWT